MFAAMVLEKRDKSIHANDITFYTEGLQRGQTPSFGGEETQ